ncbi:hypoxanthine phosphoribosyltransferase [Methylohalomonas lacus]|uniref:Hypoxanthine phosphoribosyltransferase n=1 Tax=Methylohalomonas lacus TaxID=398773 RepID=A0AAE3HKW3_9GAMM|nr:hypoxanthine-guanine phosphoribosyltransferase [Methylohalomonas lacus]MCS3902297.1 hypoxanthine phosphoribosyltransferase [Methylohalomonas lacus]
MTENKVTLTEIEQVRAEAERLFTTEQVNASYDSMAVAIASRLRDSNPLLLSVLIGGIMPTAAIMARLDFPLQVDYLHATRYREKTHGGALEWLKPPTDIQGRSILVIDDILDEGHTLREIVSACHDAGAAEVLTAVLVDKQVRRDSGLAQADFTGLTIPNRYVFGCGMDYKGYMRNLPEIYAVKGM